MAIMTLVFHCLMAIVGNVFALPLVFVVIACFLSGG